MCLRGNLQGGGGVGHYEDIAIVAVDPPYDDLVTMSSSLQEPNVSRHLAHILYGLYVNYRSRIRQFNCMGEMKEDLIVMLMPLCPYICMRRESPNK